MFVHRCRLTLHDNVYFETRAAGRLYETEQYIHNYALTYALGLVRERGIDGQEMIGTPYFVTTRSPTYAQDLTPLNGQVYVTPARPVNVSFAFHTFKYASNHYHDLSTASPPDKNRPSYGRAKELAVGSELECFIIAAKDLTKRLPRWIRLGLWMAKTQVDVTVHELESKSTKGAPVVISVPLNPLDVGTSPTVCDIISMPPVSIILNARYEGKYYELDDRARIPADMRYNFPKEKAGVRNSRGK